MPDQSRSTADIDDPVLLARAYRIDHIGLSAYFVALAAWQRGLRVTFHYDVAGKSARFENSVALSSRGEFFSVSDGKSTHFFLRTLGDLTSREISALCDDKQATKDRLLAAGVPVPDGILVDRDALDEAVLDAFLLRHAAKKFHIKPLVGSQSVGAKGHLVADEVCTAISEHKDRLLLVEEHVAGNYMRVNVVGGRFVGATGNRSPRVIGDGFATIAELIQRKNLSRRHTPLYKFAFKLDDIEKDCISSQGHSFDTILELGASALVKEAIFGSEGAESYDETATASREARELAIRSCKAMNVAVGGVDVLIDDLTGRHVVLEVNQCPMIK